MTQQKRHAQFAAPAKDEGDAVFITRSFVPPIGAGIRCGNPALGRPLVPPDSNGRPSYMFLVFDIDGNFRGRSI